jgi:hypothetical protein
MTSVGTVAFQLNRYCTARQVSKHLSFDAPTRVGWWVFFAFSRQAGNPVWFSAPKMRETRQFAVHHASLVRDV